MFVLGPKNKNKGGKCSRQAVLVLYKYLVYERRIARMSNNRPELLEENKHLHQADSASQV